jgi:hypothetical protein
VSRHRFHGDPARFEVVAEFVAGRFPDARYVADVAGGQGMLTRLLRKRYGYEAELIDPRGWSLKGVPVRVEDFDASMADYYDLVIGLHPDEALRSVVQSAERTATLVVPCCNFWSAETKLGRDELIEQIIDFHNQRGGKSEHIVLDFLGPKNHALILLPPAESSPKSLPSPSGEGGSSRSRFHGSGAGRTRRRFSGVSSRCLSPDCGSASGSSRRSGTACRS